jgi:hypothetical protein
MVTEPLLAATWVNLIADALLSNQSLQPIQSIQSIKLQSSNPSPLSSNLSPLSSNQSQVNNLLKKKLTNPPNAINNSSCKIPNKIIGINGTEKPFCNFGDKLNANKKCCKNR